MKKLKINIFLLLLIVFALSGFNIFISFADIDSSTVKNNIENYFKQYDGTSYPNEANGGSGCGAFLRGIWLEAYGSSLPNSTSISTNEIDDYLFEHAVYGDAIWWNGEDVAPHAMMIIDVNSKGVNTYESSGIGTGNIVSKKFRTYSKLHKEFGEGFVRFYHYEGYNPSKNSNTSSSNEQKNSITVKSTTVDGITQTNAVVHGEISYSGVKPSEFGLYLGTSGTKLEKVASEPQPDFEKNPFPIWYDINAETSYVLKPGKTYSWRCYAIQDGKEVKGSLKTFKTKPSTDKTTITTTTAESITSTNAVVHGEVGYTGAKPSEFGIYFGKSQNSMKKVASDPEPSFDMNPFPIWFDLNVEANITLDPNTKYYWRCYVVQNGKEYKGNTKNFKTLKDGYSNANGGGGGASSGGGNFGGGGGGGRF